MQVRQAVNDWLCFSPSLRPPAAVVFPANPPGENLSKGRRLGLRLQTPPPVNMLALKDGTSSPQRALEIFPPSSSHATGNNPWEIASHKHFGVFLFCILGLVFVTSPG